jgi:uncharacterized membrane protein
MMRKGFWILMVIFAILIGLYPSIYFFIDRKFGLLSFKSEELLKNAFWNLGFYIHIIFGGFALLVGWRQFGRKFRNRHLNLHKQLGKTYIIAVLLSSIAGICISFVATGGVVSSLGFFCLGVIWFYTTLIAYLAIRKGQIETHQKMMVYSYAVCFSAVTLRIWLPLLVMSFGNFITAYIIVAWLCWIPNIFVANLIARRMKIQKI